MTDQSAFQPILRFVFRAELLICVLGLLLLGNSPAWGQDQAADWQKSSAAALVSGVDVRPSHVQSSVGEEAVGDVSLLSEIISLQVDGVTLEEALQSIAEKGDLELVYGSHPVLSKKRVTLNLEQVTAEEALKEATQGTDLKPMFSPSGQVVLVNGAVANDSPKMKARGADFRMKPTKVQVAGKIPLRSKRSQHTVRGTVTDAENGEPLPGVNVVEQGTTTGTTTDNDGEYEVTVSSDEAVLVFSYVGYLRQEIPVDQREVIDVAMEEDVAGLEEIIVVGYGVQRASELTSSVKSLETQELTNVTKANTESLLQGKVSGMRVTTGGGDPNQEPSIVIRGTGTFGNDQPLYVIDGIKTNSMGYINPNDIESIQVLKDAAASAIYGSRAANGVVIVTTKRGEGDNQDIRVQYSGSVGIQSPIKKLDYLNAEQYRDHSIAVHQNDGLSIPPFARKENFDPSIDTDWQDVWLRNSAVYQNSLSISTGWENSFVYVSAQNIRRDGVVENTSFERNGIRLNGGVEKGIFRFEQSLSATRTINDPNTFWGRERGALPVIPVYDEDNLGGFAGVQPSYHGVARGINWYGVSSLNDRRIRSDGIIGSVVTSVDLSNNMTYQLTLGLDYQTISESNYMPAFFQSRSQEAFNDEADLNEVVNRQFDTIIESTLTYSLDLGDHNADILAGYTEERDNLKTQSVSVTEFPNNNVRTIAGANEVAGTDGGLFESRLQSAFGRINYNFNRKYLLSATGRYDGSSRFADGNKWGGFYSLSAGWRMAEEAFFPDFFDEFKLRVSYGELGNQEIGPYSTIPGLNVNASAYFAGGTQPGTALTELSNPDLVWEKTTTINGGIDASFLEGSASASMNVFQKRSNDILASVPIPYFGGVSGSVLTNAASIENYGVELEGSYGLEYDSGLILDISGNFSAVRNEVVELGEGLGAITGGGFTQQGFTATRTVVGRPIASFYGYVVDGIYQTQEEIEASGRENVQLGDFKFRDFDGDGEPDQQFIGKPQPDFEFGANISGSYKRFDFGIFIQGVQGNEVWNSTLFQYVLDNAGGNKYVTVLDSWTPDNTDTDIPRATLQDPANNKRSSTFYVEDGSYVRLKSLQIGYDLPLSVANGSYRVYVRAEDLLTFTGYSGYDPEVGRADFGLFGQGVDQNAHPRPRTFVLGMNVSF